MTSNYLRAAVLIGFAPIYSIAAEPVEEDFFELSLEQLSHIRVTGAAVRSLNLDNQPFSNNPFDHSNLQIPASIDVVDHKTIEARGLNNVVEVVESMVGVLSGESPSEPYSFSMRGFTRNSIGVLYDGVSMGMSTLNMRPQSTFNLERVEVVKGASVLNAADGSAGGTVNIITKKAQLNSNTTDVHTRYGRYNTQSYNLGFNSGGDKHAYRVDVNYHSSDGWVDDSDSDSLSSSFSYLFKPGKDVKLRFYTNYSEDNLPAYWGTPLVPSSVAQDPSTSVVETAGDDVVDLSTRFNNYNVADSVIESQSHWLRLDATWDVSKDTEIKALSYQFKADRLWKNAEFYNYNATNDNVERDRLYIGHDRLAKGLQLSLVHQFTAFNYPQKVAFDYLTSTNDFTRDLGVDFSANADNVSDTVALLNPVSGNFGSVDLRQDKQVVITDALVAHHSIALSDKFNIKSSVRLERTFFDRIYINFDNSIRERKTLDKRFNQERYFIGATYQVLDESYLYAHYSRQHDPIEDALSLYYDINNLEASDIDQFELGMKSIVNKKTEWSWALYHIDKTQSYQTADGDPVRDNHLDSEGFETAIKHSFSEQFRVGGSYAFTNAQYDEFYDTVSVSRQDNSRPVNVPEHIFHSWLSINDVFGLPLEWGLGYRYVSARYANAENTTKLKAFNLLHGFMAYQTDSYRIALSARNITDEVYAPWSDVYYPNQVALGSPRTIELSFRARF